MNARKLAMMAALLLLVTWNAAEADSVSWINGTTPPAMWAIQPVSPTMSDVITFSGPTNVYSNSCLGEKDLGGTPVISVDAVARVVTLDFRGPAPVFCAMIYMPVDGLQGDFGPLEAGDWKFISLSKALSFEIRFTVAGKVVYHVDADARGPLHDGQTWATAFLTLQDALAVAVGGDEIIMAEGTYKPDLGGRVTAGDRNASFQLAGGITIRGGFAGYGQPNPDDRDIEAHETVLSGDLNGDDLFQLLNRDENSYHVLTGPSDGEAATLDGLVVVSGNANGRFPNDLGGGLYNPGGTLMIVNCTFQSNTAALGGAILNLEGEITLVNTQLIGNQAFVSGGGLYNWEGNATLHNCRVVGNSADRAEDMGGAAIDNLTANLTVLDSTIADNLSPNGGAISSFTWDRNAGGTIVIANSILYNGGHEVSSNNMPAVSIAYSDVQGGAVGAGNIDAAPLFIAPGGRSVEGEWIDGDYHLQATSSCIDGGNDASLPADVADLNGNGNVSEPLPLDLDLTTRVQGDRVDMGAYEQRAEKPPIPGIELTCLYAGKQIVLVPDPVIHDTFTGSIKAHIDFDHTLQLMVDVTATSPAGGVWTGSVVPDTISPPGGDFTVYVKGEGVNLAALPPGSKSVQVAQAELSAAIIP